MIKRTKRKDNFTIIDNAILRSKTMSFEAKGLLCFILSLPDDWVFHRSWLIKEYNIGKDKISRCFAEIEAAGYMVKLSMLHGEDGKFSKQGYLFYDESQLEPQAGLPSAVKPLAVEPSAANPHLLNTNSKKEQSEQKTISHKETNNKSTNLKEVEDLPF